MIIDKDKLRQAKQKLGDETPFKIAQAIGLQEFDEKALKALCPVHQQDTPSFIYNAKMLNFHCFGCGCNIDIIDAYVMSGLTYSEAAQKLFNQTGVLCSFGQRGVKTKREYRYPKEVPIGDRSLVDAYFATRKISSKTLDHCDVRQDAHGNAVFNYYDTNDVLTMVKYRPSHKIDKSAGQAKNWCQANADTAPLLFNMNKVNADQPLLITQGESDCMAAIESGFLNAVSVPLGAHNYHWVQYNLEWLDQFSDIIICSDNDQPGLEMAKTVCPRLGSWRTKTVQIPQYVEDSEDGTRHKVKDLNELLYYGGKSAVMDAIMNAKQSEISSVVDLSDVKDINIADIDGVYFGVTQLDKELFKLFYGTLTLVTGRPGAGKTSFLYQIICNALQQRKNTWVFSRQLPQYMTKSWMNYLLAGPRNVQKCEGKNGSVYYRLKKDAARYIDEAYRGQWFVYKDDWPNDIDDIKQSMQASARKYGSKVFLIDNLMMVDLHAGQDDKYQKQTQFVSWLIQFAARFQVVVILVAHPRKMQTNGGAVDLYDIGGSSNLVNLAHRTLSLRRVTRQERDAGTSQFSNFSCVVSVTKDRMRGRSGFQLGLYYDDSSRRFFSNYEEFDRKYRWDANVYTDRLPCQVIDQQDQIYGH